MNAGRLILAASLTACLAACARPAPPVASAPAWKAPVCTAEPIEAAGPPLGVTMICQGTSAVSYEELHQAAVFDGAKAALAARRTHFVLGREQRKVGAPAVQCPPPDKDENLRIRMEYLSGGSVPTSASQERCKPIPGSEGHDLALVVRFLPNGEAASTPGARNVAEVLGMVAAAPPAPAPPPPAQVDGGSDGGSPEDAAPQTTRI
ncbi:MAG TPA: hypothetical protein VIU64_00980 [Polyangia bacterium]